MESRVRVAVLTLTRDRLDYTKHCFARLRENTGCAFDHYVLDQASQDGTIEWLRDEWLHNLDALGDRHARWSDRNLGIGRALNQLLSELIVNDYDVIVKFDNDCELTTPDTLKAAVEVVMAGEWLCSPRIHGLRDYTPEVERETQVAGYLMGETGLIGGIFLAAPAWLFQDYRHQDTPIWGMDDVNLCGNWKSRGHHVGYLLDHHANHYETTVGQMARYPEYFERKMAEFTR